LEQTTVIKKCCGTCEYFQLRTINSVSVKDGQGFCWKHSDLLYDWNYCVDYDSLAGSKIDETKGETT